MKRYFRYYTPVYDIEETYHIDELKVESDYTTKEIKRLESELEKLEKYLNEITSRANEVLQLEYYYFIEVKRNKNYFNKIEYIVSVKKCVVGDDGKA